VIKSVDNFVTGNGSVLKMRVVDSHRSVCLEIDGNANWFWAEDIKALRKYLKKLQRQLEQADLDTLD